MSSNKPEKPIKKKTETKETEKENQSQQSEFTPERFSVRDLRKHKGPKTSRNPKGIR